MSAQSKKGAAKAQGSGMSDAELLDVHGDLNREKHPPTANFLRAPLVFVFLFGCLVFACAIQLAHTTNYFHVHPPAPVVDLTPEEKEAKRLGRKVNSGKKIFTSKCMSCHQATGLGLPNQFPPLVGSKWATTDPAIISKIILKGLKGEIEVLGKKYGTNPAIQPMPPQQALSDREIANVATYVRKSWGNEASEVTEEQVSTFREEAASQMEQWSGSQIKDQYPDSFAGD